MNTEFDNNIPLPPPVPTSIEELKEAMRQQLYAERNSRLDALLTLGDGQTPRSPGETLTWSVKVSQAKAFQASNDLSDCPLLVIETTAYLTQQGSKEPTKAAINTGVKNLAQRLIEKEPLLQEASAQIVGIAGRFEETIAKSTSVEELQKINLTEGWN
jgi:hypothetical protein